MVIGKRPDFAANTRVTATPTTTAATNDAKHNDVLLVMASSIAIGVASAAGALLAARERAGDGDVAPVVTPGKGFTRATGEPAATGDGPGSDARAIARFDVVPYQAFDGEFPIGVVAFHINGIDRVEFCAQGGSWAAVRSMTQKKVATTRERGRARAWQRANESASLLADL